MVCLFVCFLTWLLVSHFHCPNLELLGHNREGSGLWFGHKVRKTNANFTGEDRRVNILCIAWGKPREVGRWQRETLEFGSLALSEPV